MTTHTQALALTTHNLHAIFGEPSPSIRKAAIAESWVPSGELLFTDAHAVVKTHEGISAAVQALFGEEGGDVAVGGVKGGTFVVLGNVTTLKHDEQTDTWVTSLQWGIRGADEEVKVKGWDVLTIVGGKIKTCYTFLDGV